jgi:hypothetical protein
MISKKQTTLTFSSVAIAAVITLFASGPLVAAHQAFACGGWGGGWGGGCGCGCGGGWGGWGGPIGIQPFGFGGFGGFHHFGFGGFHHFGGFGHRW